MQRQILQKDLRVGMEVQVEHMSGAFGLSLIGRVVSTTWEGPHKQITPTGSERVPGKTAFTFDCDGLETRIEVPAGTYLRIYERGTL